MKINVEIDTKTVNCDFLGELLRNYLFVNDEYAKLHSKEKDYKQFGCYETFEVRESAVKLTPLDIAVILAMYKIERYEDLKYFSYTFNYFNAKVVCIWYWDGDGTLMFFLPDRAIINTDCKCSYGWREIDEEKF